MSSRRKSKLKDEVEADAILDSTLYDFTWWSAQACGNRLPDLIQSFVSYQAQYAEELEHVQLLLAFLRSIDGQLPEIDPQLHLATYLLATVKETDDKTSDLNQLLEGARTALRTESPRSNLLPLNTFLTVHPALLLACKSKLRTDCDAQALLVGGVLLVRNADIIELTNVADGQIYGAISAETSVMFPIGQNLGVFNTKQSKLQLFDISISKNQWIKEIPLSKQKVTKPKQSAISVDAEPDCTQFVSYGIVKDSTEDSLIIYSGLNTIYVLTGLNSSESDSAKVQLFTLIDKCQSREVIGFLSSRKAFYVTGEKEVLTFDLDGDDDRFKQPIMCQAESVGRVTDSKVGIVTHFNGAYRVFMEKKIEDIGVNSASEVISTDLESEHGRDINMALISRLELGLVLLFIDPKIYWLRLSSDGKVKDRGSLAVPDGGFYSRTLEWHEFTYKKENYLFINSSPELCVCLSGSQIQIVGRIPSCAGHVLFNNKYFAWYDANESVKGEVYDLKIMLAAKPIKFDVVTPQKKLKDAYQNRCDYVNWSSTKERQIHYFVDHDQMDVGVIENGGNSIKITNDLLIEPASDQNTFETRYCNGNLLYVTEMDETSKKVDFMEYDWQKKKSIKIVSYGEAVSNNSIVYSPITDSLYTVAESDKSKVVTIDLAKKKVETYQLDEKVKLPAKFAAATSDLLLLTHESSLFVLKISGQNLILRTTHEQVDTVGAGADYYTYQTNEEGGNKFMIVDCDSCKPIKQILVPSMDGQPEKIMEVRGQTFVGNAQLVFACMCPDNYDQHTIVVYDFLAGDDDVVLPSVKICLGNQSSCLKLKGSALSNVFSARINNEFALFELVSPDPQHMTKKKLSSVRSASIKSSTAEEETHSKTCKIM